MRDHDNNDAPGTLHAFRSSPLLDGRTYMLHVAMPTECARQEAEVIGKRGGSQEHAWTSR